MGTFTGNPQNLIYLMVKTMVSCRFSQQNQSIEFVYPDFYMDHPPRSKVMPTPPESEEEAVSNRPSTFPSTFPRWWAASCDWPWGIVQYKVYNIIFDQYSIYVYRFEHKKWMMEDAFTYIYIYIYIYTYIYTYLYMYLKYLYVICNLYLIYIFIVDHAMIDGIGKWRTDRMV